MGEAGWRIAGCRTTLSTLFATFKSVYNYFKMKSRKKKGQLLGRWLLGKGTAFFDTDIYFLFGFTLAGVSNGDRTQTSSCGLLICSCCVAHEWCREITWYHRRMSWAYLTLSVVFVVVLFCLYAAWPLIRPLRLTFLICKTGITIFFNFNKKVNPKGNQPWIFSGKTNAEAEAPVLWPTDAEPTH